MSSTRQEFQAELDFIERRVELLFGECEVAVQRAVAALVEGRPDMARDTIAHDDLIDELTLSTESAVFEVIARQAPVARDLRFLISVLRVISDLERCGDLSIRVAKQVFDQTWLARAERLKPVIARLGALAHTMLVRAGEAWTARDPDAWQAIEETDVELDSEFLSFMELIRGLEGVDTAHVAVNSLIAGQALERIGDHAVCIGQRIRFLVSGEAEGLAGEIAP